MKIMGGVGYIFFGVVLFIFFIFSVLFFQLPGIFYGSSVDVKLMFIIANFLLLSFVLWCFRTVLFVPRGTPVRFNRKRQKVYVYEHQRSVWPWKRWPTVIKVFDWANIHGERVFVAGRADYGHRLYCAVCKPGTYEVVDRFILTWTVGDINMIYGLWSHCCQYMQGKAVSDKPLKTEVPLSWTPFKNIHWPEALDKESRNAPE